MEILKHDEHWPLRKIPGYGYEGREDDMVCMIIERGGCSVLIRATYFVQAKYQLILIIGKGKLRKVQPGKEQARLFPTWRSDWRSPHSWPTSASTEYGILLNPHLGLPGISGWPSPRRNTE